MTSVAILAIIVVFVGQLFKGATTISILGNKRMDTDTQARLVFDRMSVDFAQMIKRADVDIYSKGLDPEAGNDRIAFFSNVSGYYPASGSQSPLSLISFRVNADKTSTSYAGLERMAKGLVWSGVSPTATPSPSPSPNLQWMVFGGTPTLQTNWPSATLGDPSNQNYKDPDFELVGPQVLRFEYFYLLKDGSLASAPGGAGMQDVTAIVVTLAVIDPKDRVLLVASNPNIDQVGKLISLLKDFDPAQVNYDLVTSWQSALDAITDMPRPAIAGVRIYQRYFYLTARK